MIKGALPRGVLMLWGPAGEGARAWAPGLAEPLQLWPSDVSRDLDRTALALPHSAQSEQMIDG